MHSQKIYSINGESKNIAGFCTASFTGMTIFRYLAVIIIVVLTAMSPSSSAFAESAAQVLEAYGLIGTWSDECARDATKGGTRITFATRTFGTPTITQMIRNLKPGGPPEMLLARGEIQSAIRITDEKIEIKYLITNIPGPLSQEPLKELILKSGTKMKIFGQRASNPFLEKCLN